MHPTLMKGLSLGAATLIVSVMPALADGMPRRGGKTVEKDPCTYTANTALTTDYVFRGFSQSAGAPAVQGGFDATCGQFYAGVWASSIDFGRNAIANDGVAKVEMDWYAGWKPVTGHVTWDLGVIYYTYPSASRLQNSGLRGDLNYVELKVGASFAPWKDATLGQTIFYSPDYQLSSGDAWTFETAFSQNLPKVGIFSPSVSALYGFQQGSNTANYRGTFGNGHDSYSYWNAGLTLGFREKWSLDFRYWDTSVPNNNAGAPNGANNFCKGDIFQCDQRYIASLKFAL